ncbi:hypothetical protein ACFVIM_14190 [Streptomyces sp. NPDC057638]|uniref:hypothetical protein n=1 Tax=Streptomyces sp. NPDC057638 TaxID=3346190 RepID=UPI0036AB8587
MPKELVTTLSDGRRVHLPATIRTIREALPPDLHRDFTEDVENAGPDEIPGVLARWALRTPQAHDPGEDAEIARIRAGDTSGLIFLDQDDEFRSV